MANEQKQVKQETAYIVHCMLQLCLYTSLEYRYRLVQINFKSLVFYSLKTSLRLCLESQSNVLTQGPLSVEQRELSRTTMHIVMTEMLCTLIRMV